MPPWSPGQLIRRGRLALALCALLVLGGGAGSLPTSAVAEQSSQPTAAAAGALDAGGVDSCAVPTRGSLWCWGYGGDGELGYGTSESVGDDETPASVGPVSLGGARTTIAISAGDVHTCALLDDGSVRCWGFGANGELGYGNPNNVDSPASAGPVDLGAGRRATAITAGGAHTCAILDDGSVRCWGFAGSGQLGYGSRSNIGDNETPGSVGPVNLGPNRTAIAIAAGGRHTCAILDDHTVRCWGYGADGQLGYANTNNIGDLAGTTPDTVGAVDLGIGRSALAITAGQNHTCAILDDHTVRCWGYGSDGELGYGNRNTVGATETPGSVGTVDLGPGRTATAISAGQNHTCAILDNGSVRCWGLGVSGRLGYGNTNNIGDNETPGSIAPVDLGPARTAVAISAGGRHTCAMLDTGSVRCWGYGANGRLGYCNESNVGDTQTPGSAGPVNLQPGDGGAVCAGPPPGVAPTGGPASAANSDTARSKGLHACLAALAARTKHQRALTHHGLPRKRAQARRRLARRLKKGRQKCLEAYARTPGAVTGLGAIIRGKTRIELYFNAPGTDGTHPPPARSYQIKQSLRPIINQRELAQAPTLCKGACRFNVTRLGERIILIITNLHPDTIYYYVVAARDNVTAKPGPRTHTLKARTA